MNSALPLNITLVLYPSSPRDIKLHIQQEGEVENGSRNPGNETSRAHATSAPSQPQVAAHEAATSPAAASDEPESDSGNGPDGESEQERKKRNRRTKAQIAEDRKAAAASVGSVTLPERSPDALPAVSDAASASDIPVPPADVPVINPDKEKTLPEVPSQTEHAEPKAPAGDSPRETPRTTEASLRPYSHANPEHRRSLIHIINVTTGMAFAAWKNDPKIFGVVKAFQSNLEGKPAFRVDAKGIQTLEKDVENSLKNALQPVLAQPVMAEEDDVY